MLAFNTKVLSSKQAFIFHKIIFFIMLFMVILFGILLIKQNTKKVFSASMTRNYLLASGTVQDKPGQTYFFDVTSVSTASAEVDLLNVVTEYWGVPWDIFGTGQTPADNWEWTQKMRALKADIDANGNGKKVVLNLVLARDQLAKKATVGTNNSLVLTDNWSGYCYNFSANPSMKTAYTRYVDWMTRLFNPSYVNVAVEFSSYLEDCYKRVNAATWDARWNAAVDVEGSAYDAVKAVNPSIYAFPSFEINKIYGYEQDCNLPMTAAQCDAQRQAHFDLMYSKLANVKRNYFAVSTFPYATNIYDPVTGNHHMTVADILDDWFTRGGDRGGEKTLIAETGWNSTDLVVDSDGLGHPYIVFSSTEASQGDYLDRLLSDAVTRNIDVVTWWSNPDVLPAYVMAEYQCASDPSYDPTWCPVINYWRQALSPAWMGEGLFKLWGTMGIRNYDNSPKTTTFTKWQNAYNLSYIPPVPTPTPTAGPTPTPTSVPPSKVVFISSATYNGNLGGLSGADTNCQNLANAVPGLTGKTWKTWLSDGVTSAATRFAHSSVQYALINGTVVANDWTDLVDGTLRSSINITEKGTSVSSGIWTNTSISGGINGTDSNSTCSNWTNSGVSRKGKRGTSSNTNYKWTADGTTSSCNNQLRLYCFEQ